jgi:predicted NUDIX family NTP pyrophosphohydrolase
MPVMSAGILLYRLGPNSADAPEVFIAHMGGPFWASRREGAWTIPKGEYDPSAETARDAARREFTEELGIAPPETGDAELGTFVYSSGKRIVVFVADGAGFDPPQLAFGEFDLEWPPRSGRVQRFPEVDDARWVPLGEARILLVKGQRPAIDALERLLAAASTP